MIVGTVFLSILNQMDFSNFSGPIFQQIGLYTIQSYMLNYPFQLYCNPCCLLCSLLIYIAYIFLAILLGTYFSQVTRRSQVTCCYNLNIFFMTIISIDWVFVFLNTILTRFKRHIKKCSRGSDLIHYSFTLTEILSQNSDD